MENNTAYVDRKLFIRLRLRMLELGITQKRLAEKIALSPAALSSRFHAKVPFTLWDVSAICNTLNIPASDIHLYFGDGF